MTIFLVWIERNTQYQCYRDQKSFDDGSESFVVIDDNLLFEWNYLSDNIERTLKKPDTNEPKTDDTYNRTKENIHRKIMVIRHSEKINECRDHDSLTKKLSSNNEPESLVLRSKNFIAYTEWCYFLKEIEIQYKKQDSDNKIRESKKYDIRGNEMLHKSEDKKYKIMLWNQLHKYINLPFDKACLSYESIFCNISSFREEIESRSNVRECSIF